MTLHYVLGLIVGLTIALALTLPKLKKQKLELKLTELTRDDLQRKLNEFKGPPTPSTIATTTLRHDRRTAQIELYEYFREDFDTIEIIVPGRPKAFIITPFKHRAAKSN